MRAVNVKGNKVTFGDPVQESAKAKLVTIEAKANLSDGDKLDIVRLQNELIMEKLGITPPK